MKLRYKDTGTETSGSYFNINAVAEVVTSDDSAFISDLDVEIAGEWKDMRQAFKDKDIITDNYNSHFFVPLTLEDKNRGYTLD